MVKSFSRIRRVPLVAAIALAASALSLGVTSAASSTGTEQVSPGAAPATTQTHSERQWAVGRREFTFVDHSRPTQADPNRSLPAKPSRTLPVRLLYPAKGDPSLPVTNSAPAADGARPLIVFSHGFTANGPTYEAMVLNWVRSGYTVALPTFPLTSGANALLADYINQPEDVTFVINSVLKLNRTQGHPLYHRINGTKLIAAGHSLGAITTYGVAYHSGVRDPRIDAAIPLSGAQLPFPGGNYNSRPPIPLFLGHGVLDGTLGVGLSDGMFNDATGPVSYLRLNNAGHTDLFFGAEGALLNEGVLSFLDEHIRGIPGSQINIANFVAFTGLGEWRQR